MEMYLPYPDFHESVRCLDDLRLKRQLEDAHNLLLVLLNVSNVGADDPIVDMWRGFVPAVGCYMNAVIIELKKRDMPVDVPPFPVQAFGDEIQIPDWVGDDVVHSQSRKRLVEVDPDWYGQLGW